MSEKKKRRNKSYYFQSKKAKNVYEIAVGMRGFLITCNHNEAKAVVEAYKLLNEYADKHFGASNLEDKEEKDSVSEEEDIEAELKKHVEGFKNKPVKERRFQNVNTRVKSVVFIKTTLEDPAKLVEHIFDDTLETGLAHSRFILRLVPVLGTCKAEEDKLTQLCEEQFSKYLQEHDHSDELTFSTLYKVRCNNVMNRDMIYTSVNKALKGLKPLAKVDYDNPDLVINVNVIPKICCLSILRNYNKYKKYNLNELLVPSALVAANKGEQSCIGDAVSQEIEMGSEQVCGEAVDADKINDALVVEGEEGEKNTVKEKVAHSDFTFHADFKSTSELEGPE